MDIRKLRCFQAVAIELHFGRAARRLRMTQPALTVQIQRLEKELGGSLLYRDHNHVELTPAGRVLAASSARVLAHVDRLEGTTAALAGGDHHPWRIGFAGSTMFSGLQSILSDLHAAVPDVTIEVTQRPIRALIDGLRSWELDMVFVRAIVEDPAISGRILAHEELVAALPAGHPLSRQRALQLRDLEPEGFIGFAGPFGLDLRDYISSACASAGFTPAYVKLVSDVQSLVGLVASGVGVSLVPKGVAAALSMADIAYVTFDRERPSSDFSVQWLREREGHLSSALDLVGLRTDTKSITTSGGRRGVS